MFAPLGQLSQNCINVQERWIVKGSQGNPVLVKEISLMFFIVCQPPTFHWIIKLTLGNADSTGVPSTPLPCHLLVRASGVCCVLLGDGSQLWLLVITRELLSAESALPLPDCFSISSVDFAVWASTAAFSTPLVSQAGCWVSHCDNSPFSPVGLPSLWASFPCLTFPSFFSKLGSGSCGELCGEDKYLLLESQSHCWAIQGERSVDKILLLANYILDGWMGCNIYLSWLSCPMAYA